MMVSLPTGTVTFLFTDIEGSTRLAQANPAAWEAARQRHHAILHATSETHQGYVFQVVGDAFCVAFHTAPDALAAALDAQRALQSQFNNQESTVIHVRMGIHTGSAALQDADYHGYLTLSLVQRLMSAASGGQVLLSDASQALAREQLPVGVTLRDLGEVRFRDFPRPEVVFQLVAADLPADFPPLSRLNTVPNNLPLQLTSFIGRAGQIAQVKQLLLGTDQQTIKDHANTTVRLLTLAGAGGTGKTRLSLQVGADMLGSYPDGVWFVELAPLSNPALISQAVTAALGIREEPGRQLLTTLIDYLRARRLLLLLDNCEHLIDGCAQLAATVLRAAPRVQILATSREPLSIEGELTWPVPPLALPELRQLPELEQLRQVEAVQLFIERSIAVRPSFSLSETNAPLVSQICWRLDGIPLAIELAAARMRALSVEDISTRLNDRFRLLTSSNRTGLPRHQTLRSAIEWSYDLLTEPERTLLRRLSVFAGGCTTEAAESVCAGDGLDELEIVNLLSNLVDKSLVVADEQNETIRYRMLETIRQYADDYLVQSGEADRVKDRHLDFFLELGEKAETRFTGAEQVRTLNRLELEHENVRLALAWSMESVQSLKALRLSRSLFWFWFLHGHVTEGIEQYESLLKQPDLAGRTPARAKALYSAGHFHWARGEFKEAQLLEEESLAIGRALDDKLLVATTLQFLGPVMNRQGDFPTAQSLLEEGLVLWRQLGDVAGITLSLNFLGDVVLDQGNYPKAQAHYEEAAGLLKQSGDMLFLGYALRRLAQLALFRGDVAAASAFNLESLHLNREADNNRGIAASMVGLAGAAAATGKLVRAAKLLGAAESLLDSNRVRFLPADLAQQELTQASIHATLEHEVYLRALTDGRSMSSAQAIELALRDDL